MNREIVLTALALVVVLALFGWYEYEYPCTRTESVWVHPRIELQHQPDGNVSPQLRPGHWQLVCVERTTRSE